MPTQMLLKYRTPSSHVAEAIARMAAQSECQHFRGRSILDRAGADAGAGNRGALRRGADPDGGWLLSLR
ncbi:MAG: hypothetical protein R2991_08635 [Thermoanaerobaculia bacterium]